MEKCFGQEREIDSDDFMPPLYEAKAALPTGENGFGKKGAMAASALDPVQFLRLLALSALWRLFGWGQHYGKSRANALAGEHLEVAAVAFDDPAGDGEAQPRAAAVAPARRIGAVE